MLMLILMLVRSGTSCNLMLIEGIMLGLIWIMVVVMAVVMVVVVMMVMVVIMVVMVVMTLSTRVWCRRT